MADDVLPFSTTPRCFFPFWIGFELEFGSRREYPEAWKLRATALLEVGNDLADQVVQLIGGFGLGDAGLLR